MNPRTALSQSEIADLAGRYEVGYLVGSRPIGIGIENSNYFLQTEFRGAEREWVLTLLEQPSYAGAHLIELLEHCHAAGLPVAPVVRNRQGEPMERSRGKPVLLAPSLPGQHPQRPTLAQIRTLGATLGRLHLAVESLAASTPPYPRTAGWLNDHAARIRPRLGDADVRLLDAARRRALALLGSVEALPEGVIHGDLFRDNALFVGDALTGLVDFHHAARGWLSYDLAVAANDWCNASDYSLSTPALDALLAGYHAERPLTQAERTHMPVMLVYAALTFWLSREMAQSQAEAGQPVRVKDPRIFRRIVAERLNRLSG